MVEFALMKRFFVSLPLLLSMTMLAPGQDSKPDFSGKWIFNVQKSALQIPAPSSMTLQIDQHDPHVHLIRVQVYGDTSDTWTLDAATDDQREIVQQSPLYVSRSRLYWYGNSLILDEKIVAGDGSKATNIVKYSLDTDGKTLVALETEKTKVSRTTNKWVYDKQTQ
jgi:hypothetical protein